MVRTVPPPPPPSRIVPKVTDLAVDFTRSSVYIVSPASTIFPNYHSLSDGHFIYFFQISNRIGVNSVMTFSSVDLPVLTPNIADNL